VEPKTMQNRSAKNAPLDMEKWQEIINEWQQSGGSQQAYCERLGLNFNTFAHARSKLLSTNKPKTKFIPVTIKNISEEKKVSSASTLVLENPHGYKLHLSTSLPIEDLSKLFQLAGWNYA
jgi:hypothetical protein